MNQHNSPKTNSVSSTACFAAHNFSPLPPAHLLLYSVRTRPSETPVSDIVPYISHSPLGGDKGPHDGDEQLILSPHRHALERAAGQHCFVQRSHKISRKTNVYQLPKRCYLKTPPAFFVSLFYSSFFVCYYTPVKFILSLAVVT